MSVSRPELTCPQTGESCEYPFYCTIRRRMFERGEGLDDPIMELLAERLPGDALIKLGEVSFCADVVTDELVRTIVPPEGLEGLGTPDITAEDMDFMSRNDRTRF